MRYPASEKLEIIRIVEQSHLPAKRTLDQLGVARRTFYRWYDRYLEGGPEALADRPSAPSRVWNRIGDEIQQQIVEKENHLNFLAGRFPSSDRLEQQYRRYAESVRVRQRFPEIEFPRFIAGQLHSWARMRGNIACAFRREPRIMTVRPSPGGDLAPLARCNPCATRSPSPPSGRAP